MTYITFLAGFIGVPTLIAAVLNLTLHNSGRFLPSLLRAWPALPVVGGHILLAVLYTSPWDNYLVATKIWWYDPALVSGLILGFVPIEEYLFFVTQTLLAGLWTLAAARILRPPDHPFHSRPMLRFWASGLTLLLWVYGVYLLASRRGDGAYLGLELAWALIPIGVQLAFGADILWHFRRHITWTLIPATVYLSLADAFAIRAGIWTINQESSYHLLIGGILPVEEFVFFLLTTTLVAFGMTLVLAQPSHERANMAKFRRATG